MKKVTLCLMILSTIGCQIVKPQSDYKIEAIEKHAEKMAKGDEFSGAILIAKNDSVLLKRAYGFSNLSHQVVNNTETKFGIASMGKMFTAVAIMQLKENGLLNLNNTVGEILKDYPNAEVRKKVTVHHLLTHTSGMGDFFNDKYESTPGKKINKLADYLPFFQMDSLAFDPGEENSYSNAGYIMLGLIIEKITKQSYYEYVTEHVFHKSGMNNTGWETDLVVSNLAEGYEYSFPNEAWRKTNIGDGIATSAGGGYSTVGDLFIFAKALNKNLLISEKSKELMLKDHTKHKYGYGFSLKEINKEIGFGHNGGAPGSSAELDVFINSGYIIVILSNRSPYDGWAEIRTFTRKELLGSTPSIERFLNSKNIIVAYKKQGFENASKISEKCEGKISESFIMHHADKYRQQKKYKESVDLINIVIEAHRESWFAISTLADIFLEKGEDRNALIQYKKSLSINPDNDWAREKISLLEKE